MIKKVLLRFYLYIFAREAFGRFNLFLFHLSLRGMGVLNYEDGRVSGEDYLIKKILPKIIKNNNPVFFDVGANIGNYSANLAKAFPKAIIYALEPQPKNFLNLKENIKSNRIKALNVAAGRIQSELPLYDRADIDGSSHASLYQLVISELHGQVSNAIPVLVDTLDNISDGEGISYIDFLKIDTEGCELSVLKGASKLIKNNRIGCIQFEFNEMNIISRAFLRDFRDLLTGYSLYRLLPNSVLSLDGVPLHTEIFAYQNILAIRKKSGLNL